MKLKNSCCRKYKRKARTCKACPLMALLTKQERRHKLKKIKQRLKKAA